MDRSKMLDEGIMDKKLDDCRWLRKKRMKGWMGDGRMVDGWMSRWVDIG